MYSIANSNGMNGMGPDTTIKITELNVIQMCRIGAIIFGVLFVFSAVMWVLGARKFKQTDAYKDYKTFKAGKGKVRVEMKAK